MRQLTRRQFVQSAASGLALVPAVPRLLAAAAPAEAAPGFAGSDVVPLGKTGIRVSRLALGTGFNGYRRSSAQTRQGKEAFDRLLRRGLDQGLTFIDMADLYGSHPFVKDVIKDLPRDKFQLLTKIWPRQESWNTPSGGARQELDRFRRELGTERVEVCLIHCMTNDRWTEEYKGIRDELSELKDRGVVGAVGVSCHDFGALKVAAKDPWVDVIFARINYKGGREFSCDAPVAELTALLKQARASGKAIVGMKIFGAGKLIQPEEKDASLRYVFQQGLVDAITIGMMNPAEVDDTLQHMSQVRAA
jgi:1-deoxyxylulose-5-phosphate synthase